MLQHGTCLLDFGFIVYSVVVFLELSVISQLGFRQEKMIDF